MANCEYTSAGIAHRVSLKKVIVKSTINPKSGSASEKTKIHFASFLNVNRKIFIAFHCVPLRLSDFA